MDDHGREPGEPTDDSPPGPVTTELPPPEPAAPARRPLRRSASDKVIAGVAGGLAENFGVSSLAVRSLFGLAFVVIAWQVWTLLGIAIVAYVLLWIFVPREDIGVSPAGRLTRRFPRSRPGHRGAAPPRGRRGDRRATRRLARLARAADRRRGAAVSVRRGSWRPAVGRPLRTGRHASCGAAPRVRRAAARTSRASPAARTFAARLARTRDRAARGRSRGDRAEPRRARHPPGALPGASSC